MSRRQFQGSLEMRKRQEQELKNARLLRINQVRRQEQDIASVEAAVYRMAIAERKHQKAEALRQQKAAQAAEEFRQTALLWQQSVVNTGYAHRNAKETNDLAQSKAVLENKSRRQRELVAIRREQQALLTHRSEVQKFEASSIRAKELLQVKQQYMLSEREDAKASGEAYQSKVLSEQYQRQMKQEAAVMAEAARGRDQIVKITQSADSIIKRFPVPVHVGIKPYNVRSSRRSGGDSHDDNDNDEEATISSGDIRNTASQFELVALKARWNEIMTELISRRKVKARARIAKRTVKDMKVVDRFTQELILLDTTDKAGDRSNRVHSAAQVPIEGQNIRALDAFQQLFMSRKEDYDALDGFTGDDDVVGTGEASYFDDFGEPGDSGGGGGGGAKRAGGAAGGVGYDHVIMSSPSSVSDLHENNRIGNSATDHRNTYHTTASSSSGTSSKNNYTEYQGTTNIPPVWTRPAVREASDTMARDDDDDDNDNDNDNDRYDADADSHCYDEESLPATDTPSPVPPPRRTRTAAPVRRENAQRTTREAQQLPPPPQQQQQQQSPPPREKRTVRASVPTSFRIEVDDESSTDGNNDGASTSIASLGYPCEEDKEEGGGGGGGRGRGRRGEGDEDAGSSSSSSSSSQSTHRARHDSRSIEEEFLSASASASAPTYYPSVQGKTQVGILVGAHSAITTTTTATTTDINRTTSSRSRSSYSDNNTYGNNYTASSRPKGDFPFPEFTAQHSSISSSNRNSSSNCSNSASMSSSSSDNNDGTTYGKGNVATGIREASSDERSVASTGYSENTDSTPSRFAANAQYVKSDYLVKGSSRSSSSRSSFTSDTVEHLEHFNNEDQEEDEDDASSSASSSRSSSSSSSSSSFSPVLEQQERRQRLQSQQQEQHDRQLSLHHGQQQQSQEVVIPTKRDAIEDDNTEESDIDVSGSGSSSSTASTVAAGTLDKDDAHNTSGSSGSSTNRTDVSYYKDMYEDEEDSDGDGSNEEKEEEEEDDDETTVKGIVSSEYGTAAAAVDVFPPQIIRYDPRHDNSANLGDDGKNGGFLQEEEEEGDSFAQDMFEDTTASRPTTTTTRDVTAATKVTATDTSGASGESVSVGSSADFSVDSTERLYEEWHRLYRESLKTSGLSTTANQTEEAARNAAAAMKRDYADSRRPNSGRREEAAERQQQKREHSSNDTAALTTPSTYKGEDEISSDSDGASSSSDSSGEHSTGTGSDNAATRAVPQDGVTAASRAARMRNPTTTATPVAVSGVIGRNNITRRISESSSTAHVSSSSSSSNSGGTRVVLPLAADASRGVTADKNTPPSRPTRQQHIAVEAATSGVSLSSLLARGSRGGDGTVGGNNGGSSANIGITTNNQYYDQDQDQDSDTYDSVRSSLSGGNLLSGASSVAASSSLSFGREVLVSAPSSITTTDIRRPAVANAAVTGNSIRDRTDGASGVVLRNTQSSRMRAATMSTASSLDSSASSSAIDSVSSSSAGLYRYAPAHTASTDQAARSAVASAAGGIVRSPSSASSASQASIDEYRRMLAARVLSSDSSSENHSQTGGNNTNTRPRTKRTKPSPSPPVYPLVSVHVEAPPSPSIYQLPIRGAGSMFHEAVHGTSTKYNGDDEDVNDDDMLPVEEDSLDSGSGDHNTDYDDDEEEEDDDDDDDDDVGLDSDMSLLEALGGGAGEGGVRDRRGRVGWSTAAATEGSTRDIIQSEIALMRQRLLDAVTGNAVDSTADMKNRTIASQDPTLSAPTAPLSRVGTANRISSVVATSTTTSTTVTKTTSNDSNNNNRNNRNTTSVMFSHSSPAQPVAAPSSTGAVPDQRRARSVSPSIDQSISRVGTAGRSYIRDADSTTSNVVFSSAIPANPVAVPSSSGSAHEPRRGRPMQPSVDSPERHHSVLGGGNSHHHNATSGATSNVVFSSAIPANPVAVPSSSGSAHEPRRGRPMQPSVDSPERHHSVLGGGNSHHHNATSGTTSNVVFSSAIPANPVAVPSSSGSAHEPRRGRPMQPSVDSPERHHSVLGGGNSHHHNATSGRRPVTPAEPTQSKPAAPLSAPPVHYTEALELAHTRERSSTTSTTLAAARLQHPIGGVGSNQQQEQQQKQRGQQQQHSYQSYQAAVDSSSNDNHVTARSLVVNRSGHNNNNNDYDDDDDSSSSRSSRSSRSESSSSPTSPSSSFASWSPFNKAGTTTAAATAAAAAADHNYSTTGVPLAGGGSKAQFDLDTSSPSSSMEYSSLGLTPTKSSTSTQFMSPVGKPGTGVDNASAAVLSTTANRRGVPAAGTGTSWTTGSLSHTMNTFDDENNGDYNEDDDDDDSFQREIVAGSIASHNLHSPQHRIVIADSGASWTTGSLLSNTLNTGNSTGTMKNDLYTEEGTGSESNRDGRDDSDNYDGTTGMNTYHDAITSRTSAAVSAVPDGTSWTTGSLSNTHNDSSQQSSHSIDEGGQLGAAGASWTTGSFATSTFNATNNNSQHRQGTSMSTALISDDDDADFSASSFGSDGGGGGGDDDEEGSGDDLSEQSIDSLVQ